MNDNSDFNNIGIFAAGIVFVMVAFFLFLSGKEQMAYGVMVFTIPVMIFMKIFLTVDDWRNE